jgi:tetratricopeptide (TPR) repeat protein
VIHLDSKQIAEHLARHDEETSRHLEACPACAGAASATQLLVQCAMAEDPEPIRMASVAEIREVLARAADERERDPRASLKLARQAVSMASTVSAHDPAAALLTAAAWRETANALRFLGQYREGLRALDNAEAALEETLVGDFEQARIDFVRATLLWKLREDVPRARQLAQGAAETFAEYGETKRVIHARLLLAGIDFDLRAYADAAATFRKVLPEAEQLNDLPTIATITCNLAICEQELGDYASAAARFSEAISLFQHLDFAVELDRTRWSLALLSLRRGQTADGRKRLAEVAASFLQRGDASDGALVTLDLVEHLAASGAHVEARRILERTRTSMLPEFITTHFEVITAALERADLPERLRDSRLQLQAVALEMS